MKSQRGFTLLELIITLGIVFLIMAASLPSLVNVTNNQRLQSTSNQCVVSMRYARERAVSTGRMHEVRFKILHNMWEVYTKDWDGGVLKEELVKQYPVDRRIKIKSANFFGMNKVCFTWDGCASATGNVVFEEVKTRGRNQRTVGVLASTGKITVQ